MQRTGWSVAIDNEKKKKKKKKKKIKNFFYRNKFPRDKKWDWEQFDLELFLRRRYCVYNHHFACIVNKGNDDMDIKQTW